MCRTSSISAKPAGELQPEHGGKDVCLRSQISPELGQREWSGRQMPETGTISPLRNGTWPDFFIDSFGDKIIFSIGMNSVHFSLWIKGKWIATAGIESKQVIELWTAETRNFSPAKMSFRHEKKKLPASSWIAAKSETLGKQPYGEILDWDLWSLRLQATWHG